MNLESHASEISYGKVRSMNRSRISPRPVLDLRPFIEFGASRLPRAPVDGELREVVLGCDTSPDMRPRVL